ncbi:MAG TPA: protease pro-enzyme activation domain-containing protein, partial [Candidatus Acidoferrales bacterium]|nr:protease pro-enzyme activation domain-containing protein [Candidatus Acidoferrales bacterium]
MTAHTSSRRRWRALLCLAMLLSPMIVAAQPLRRVGVIPPLARRNPSVDADPATLLNMSMTLHSRDEAGLRELLQAQSNPASRAHGDWLTPVEFGERFGADAAVYESCVAWLRGEGFDVRTWPNQLRIDFSGTADQAGRTFQVAMRSYRRGDQSVVANAEPPAVPEALADSISSLRLHNAPIAHPLLRINTASARVTLLGPHDMYRAYNLQPLLDSGFDGSGQTVAVVARSDYSDADVA